MQQQEYDFSLFESNRARAAKPAPEKKSPLQSVKGGKRKAAARAGDILRNAWFAFLTVLLLTMVVLMLQSKAQITTLNAQVRSTKSELTEQQSTYNYLSNELSSRTRMSNIEEVANKLGLLKLDDSQVTYVRLDDAGVSEKEESPASAWYSWAQNGLLSMLDAFES